MSPVAFHLLFKVNVELYHVEGKQKECNRPIWDLNP